MSTWKLPGMRTRTIAVMVLSTYVLIVSIVDRVKHPGMSEVQLLMRWPKALICDFS